MKGFIKTLFIGILFLTGCSSDFTGSFDEKGDLDRLVIQKVADGETSSSRTKTVKDADTIAEIMQKGEGLGAQSISGEEAQRSKDASTSYYTFTGYKTDDAPVYSIIVLEDGTFLVEGSSGNSEVMETTDTHQLLLDDMKELADLTF